MNKLIVVAFIAIISSVQSHAAELKGGYGACVTEELFEQLTSAMVSNDENSIDHLLNNGCIVTKSGIKITVLDNSLLSGVSKVRAYVGNNEVILWTDRENILK